jgi:hypothetical protein
VKNTPRIAKTDYAFSLNRPRPNDRPQITKNADGSFSAKTFVEWKLDEANTVIMLPSFRWPNMTPAEQQAVRDFLDALQYHENGHIIVAETVVKDFNSPFAGDLVSEPSPTPQDAIKDLRDKLKKLGSGAQAEQDRLAADDGEYDMVTDHGRQQREAPPKFPGGPNVVLRCPTGS